MVDVLLSMLFFQTGAEVMELFHAAVMDVASPIFF